MNCDQAKGPRPFYNPHASGSFAVATDDPEIFLAFQTRASFSEDGGLAVALQGPWAPPGLARVGSDEMQVRPPARGSRSGTEAAGQVSGACSPGGRAAAAEVVGPGPALNDGPSQAW